MTLKEFKEGFPDIYKKYEENSYSRNMKLKPIDRMLNFIESVYDFSLNSIQHETRNNCRPSITIEGRVFNYDTRLSVADSKSFLISKSLEYIATGRIY